LTTLRLLYIITVDMVNPTYLGMTTQHDTAKQTISCSMPGYIDKVLTRFRAWAGTKTESRQVCTPLHNTVPRCKSHT
jgi:hypothetical protein